MEKEEKKKQVLRACGAQHDKRALACVKRVIKEGK